MKTFKKISAVMLTLLMVLACVPAMAETVTAEIVGDAVLFAPPTDVISRVTYELKPSSGTVSTIAWSMSKAVAGVTLDPATGVLTLDGAAIAVDSFTLTAEGTTDAGSSFTDSIDISIPDVRFDYNFDDSTEGNTATSRAYSLSSGAQYPAVLNGQSGQTAKVAAESDGNLYVACSGYTNYLQFEPDRLTAQAAAVQSAKRVTMRARIKAPGAYGYTLKDNASSSWAMQVSGNKLNEKHGIIGDGGTVTNSSYAATGATVSSSTWSEMNLVLDYERRLYSVYLEKALVVDGYHMLNSTVEYFDNAYFEVYVDDIAYYSGTPVFPETTDIQGDATLLAPPVGVKSAVTYTLLDNLTTPQAVTENVTWSVEGALPAGVAFDSATGTVTLDGSLIAAGSFTLKAESPYYVASKTITIPDCRYFEDFEGQTPGSQFKIYARKLDGGIFTAADGITQTGNVAQSKVQVAQENDATQTDGKNNYASVTPVDGANVTYANVKHDWYSISSANKMTTVSFRMKVPSSGSYSMRDTGNTFGISSSNYTLTHAVWDGTYNDKGEKVSQQVATPGTFSKTGWTDVRIVTDYYNETYSVYVDDFLAIQDADMLSSTAGFLNQFYMYAPIDDYAFYSGEAVVEDYITVDGAVFDTEDDTKVLNDGASHTVKAHFGGVSAVNEEKSLILAHYDASNKLVDLDFVTWACDGKYSLGARLDGVSGGTVKVMLWNNAEQLQPLQGAVPIQ